MTKHFCPHPGKTHLPFSVQAEGESAGASATPPLVPSLDVPRQDSGQRLSNGAAWVLSERNVRIRARITVRVRHGQVTGRVDPSGSLTIKGWIHMGVAQARGWQYTTS